MTEAFEDSESGLQVFKPNLEPRVQTPPPFANQGVSPTSENEKDANKIRKPKYPTELTHGGKEAITALLHGTIGAYQPGIARYETEHPAPFHIDDHYRPSEFTTIRPKDPGDLREKAKKALGFIDRPALRPLGPGDPHCSQTISQPDFANSPEKTPDSHSLSKFLITKPQSHNSLPALRDPSTARSPDNIGTKLPPIQTQLAQLVPVLPPPNAPSIRPVGTSTSPYPFSAVPGVSPPLTRAEPSPWEPHRLAPLGPPKIPPSPYSHLSPANSQLISAVSSPVSTQSGWRSGPKPTVAYPHDPNSTVSRSPASNYPTPIEQNPTGAYDPANYGSPSQANTVIGTFKCTYSGCTALPFQTQYLLNSHANVHSQDRPHFCPIDGCSRGPGGKGFKRKNEMIRHGLVHNSPGYVCPFCPDQQHKYPRPDNLQRHVRVHHVDKNKDDPALRNVLSQRPEGSGRGRRRRLNA
ncbi:hypothetical protein BJX99DRAFT_253833 [Aspergillus californicus]